MRHLLFKPSYSLWFRAFKRTTLFVLLTYNVGAQNITTDFWDTEISNLPDSTMQSMLSLCTQKWQQLVRSDVDSSLIYAQKAVEITKLLQNDSLLFQSYRRVANSYIQQGSFAEARGVSEQMLSFIPAKDPYCSYRYHQTLGLVDFYEGNYEEALKNHFASLGYAQQGNLLNDIPAAYAEISRVFDEMGQPLKALEYAKEDLAFTLEHGGNRSKFIAHYNLANRFVALDSFDLALGLYNQADSMAQILEIPVFKDAVILSKGRLYNQMGESEQAIPLLGRALDGMRRSGNRRGVLTAQANLGNALNDLGRYGQSIPILQEAYQGVINDGNQQLAQIVRQAYAEALYHSGQGGQAYQLLDEYRIIQDSIKGEETNRSINELEIQYQTAEKERELLEQQLVVDQRTRQRNGLLLIAGLLGSLILFVYLYQRQRIRNNQLIAEQENALKSQKIQQLENEKKLLAMSSMIEGQEAERMRIARDLHDGLGGLLGTLKAHFNSIQREIQELESINVYDKVNNLIDTASTEVRRISHNMVPHALQMLGLHDALQDFCAQVQTDRVQLQYEWSGSKDRLAENTEIMLYRITQELINNALKYAHPANILVQINRFEDELNLIVEDDGIGFDVDKAIQKGGMGLKSVRSRVNFLNGVMDVISSSNEGTSYSIQIPLSNK